MSDLVGRSDNARHIEATRSVATRSVATPHTAIPHTAIPHAEATQFAQPRPVAESPADELPVPRLPSPRPRRTTATVAGTALAGRYRLHTRVGADTVAGTEYWCAQDLVLQRDVGVTVLRRRADEHGAIGGADDPTSSERASEMIVRALRSGCFEHIACARLLDVLSPGAEGLPNDVLGAAITEWVPGRSLAEVVAGAPLRPIAVARALQPLASAVEEAHRHGLVLGCDQPQRIRIRPDGGVQLCFALPRPEVRPSDDVRGLGAVLVTLLTSRWPLSGADGARAGLAPAERTPAGTVPAPSTLRPGVPVELDALATGTLGPDNAPGHVHTAAAVCRLLTEVIEEHDSLAMLPPIRDGLPSDPNDVWQDGNQLVRPADPRQRRRLTLGLVALALGVVAVLGYTGAQIVALVSDPAGPPIVVDDTGPAQSGRLPAGGLATLAGVAAYGDGSDNPERLNLMIDRNQSSSWNSAHYRQQLPTLKPGVGVIVSFTSPVQLSSLSIFSPSPGTRLEIRAAATPDAEFADTVPIARAVLADGRTDVSLAQSQPVQHVLLWITKLGGGDGDFVTDIRELEFRRTQT